MNGIVLTLWFSRFPTLIFNKILDNIPPIGTSKSLKENYKTNTIHPETKCYGAILTESASTLSNQLEVIANSSPQKDYVNFNSMPADSNKRYLIFRKMLYSVLIRLNIYIMIYW